MIRHLEQRRRARFLGDADRWRRQAACRTMGPDLFFPAGERDEAAVAQTAAAKQVCAGCPVRLHCLTFALVVDPQDGIWGGLGPSERRAVRRARRARRARRWVAPLRTVGDLRTERPSARGAAGPTP